MREQLIRRVNEELMNEGFSACVCFNTRSCFDIAARRENILLLKVLENIDAFSEEQARNMHKISSMLLGHSFLIGEKSKEYVLEDEVLYERYGISACNVGTFKGIVRGTYPTVRKFNNAFALVDGKKLVVRRGEEGLSVEELARLSGISVESLYRYENELVMTLKENIEKLERVLGTSLKKQIDPFQENEKVKTTDFFGLKSVRTKYPFNILAKEKNNKDKVIVGSNMDERTAMRRAALYKEVSDIFKSYACFMLRKTKSKSYSNIPVLLMEELQEIKSSGEFIKLVKERNNA